MAGQVTMTVGVLRLEDTAEKAPVTVTETMEDIPGIQGEGGQDLGHGPQDADVTPNLHLDLEAGLLEDVHLQGANLAHHLQEDHLLHNDHHLGLNPVHQ